MTITLKRWSVLLFIVSLCVTVQAQEKPQEVKIASGGHIVHFLPLDLAVALGYFEDEGLEPKITYLKGGTATAQALISGQVDFSTNSIDHAFKAAVQGKDNLRMIVLLNRTPGMVLVVDTKHKDAVKTIADLKGMRLGVTSLGSATHMVLAFLLSKNGVAPDDVTVAKAGSSTFPPALKNGSIDGGIALEPFASMMIDRGEAFVLQRLITMEDSERAFGGPYNQAGILTRKSILETDRVLVEKVVTVLVRALQFLQDHDPEEIADILPSEVVGPDKKGYIRTLGLLREFYSPSGIVDTIGVRNVLESMKIAGAIKKDTDLDPLQYLNNSFIQRLSSSGAGSELEGSNYEGIRRLTPHTNEGGNNLRASKLLASLGNADVEWQDAPISGETNDANSSQIDAAQLEAPGDDMEPEDLPKDNLLSSIGDYLIPPIIALLTGGLVGLGFYRRQKKLDQQYNENFEQKLEEATKSNIKQWLKKFGFWPLGIDLDERAKNGLELFEDEICRLATKATQNLKMCVMTPLLHSLRLPWNRYNQHALTDESHWAHNFCERLVNVVRRRKLDEEIELEIDIIFADDNLLQKILRFIPDTAILDFEGYQDAIQEFFSKLQGNNEDKFSKLHYCQVPESPFYFALTDVPTDEELPMDTTAGVMAFINCQDLIKQRTESKSAQEMARNMQSYAFTNPEVVKFMARIFETLALQKDVRLYSFFQQCATHDYELGLVMKEGIPSEITDVIKEGYDDKVDYLLLRYKAPKSGESGGETMGS